MSNDTRMSNDVRMSNDARICLGLLIVAVAALVAFEVYSSYQQRAAASAADNAGVVRIRAVEAAEEKCATLYRYMHDPGLHVAVGPGAVGYEYFRDLNCARFGMTTRHRGNLAEADFAQRCFLSGQNPA